MLWGNLDYPNSNNKPLFANTTTTSSNSSINGESANVVYGVVAGVSAGEQERSNNTSQHPTHAGWVAIKTGTGSITSVSITGAGNVNANGFIVLTDNTAHGIGVANISYTINAATFNVETVTIVDGGSGWSNASDILYTVSAANLSQPTLAFTLGGRAGRKSVETLVAMGSITLDDPSDNVFFTGV